MSFNRLDDLRSSLGGERRGRGLFRRAAGGGESPLSSPLFRRKQLSLNDDLTGGGFFSGPPSLASSRESSCDRGNGGDRLKVHDVFERVRGSSPRLSLRKRFQVIRSGSFSAAGLGGGGGGSGGDLLSATDRRRKWLLGRSESLRGGGGGGFDDRRGSLPPPPPRGELSREPSLDSVNLNNSLNDVGKVKGFVHR